MFNNHKDEMKKSKKGKQMKFVCYQCVRKKKNNEFKSEIAKIRLSIKKNNFQRQKKINLEKKKRF